MTTSGVHTPWTVISAIVFLELKSADGTAISLHKAPPLVG
jgi:hypothetical protein